MGVVVLKKRTKKKTEKKKGKRKTISFVEFLLFLRTVSVRSVLDSLKRIVKVFSKILLQIFFSSHKKKKIRNSVPDKSDKSGAKKYSFVMSSLIVSEEDVIKWLEAQGMGEYKNNFKGIDGIVFFVTFVHFIHSFQLFLCFVLVSLFFFLAPL